MPKTLVEHSSGVSVRYFQALLNHQSAGLINESLTDSKLEGYGALEGGAWLEERGAPERVHLDMAIPSSWLPVYLSLLSLFCLPMALKASDHELKHLKPENKFPP